MSPNSCPQILHGRLFFCLFELPPAFAFALLPQPEVPLAMILAGESDDFPPVLRAGLPGCADTAGELPVAGWSSCSFFTPSIISSNPSMAADIEVLNFPPLFHHSVTQVWTVLAKKGMDEFCCTLLDDDHD